MREIFKQKKRIKEKKEKEWNGKEGELNDGPASVRDLCVKDPECQRLSTHKYRIPYDCPP